MQPRRTLNVIGLAGAVALMALPVAGGPHGDSATTTATCLKVLDGDTLVVTCQRRDMTVELDGVDAPELGQPLGRQVRALVRDLVRGREITIEMVEGDATGGRARVSVAGHDLSALLAERGLAWATGHGELAASAAKARAARCGIWLDPDPVPPWEFRKATT